MSSNSKKLQTFNIKKDERAISKKRKLEAFLNLVRKEDSTSMPKKKVGNFQESYKTLKDELKQYQKKEVADPLFYLTDSGQSAQVKFASNIRSLASTSPLFIEDVYHLLLKSVIGNLSPFPLKWSKLERPQNVSKTVVIEIDNLSEANIFELNSELNRKSNIFRYIFEVISSSKHFATELSTMHMVENYYSNTQGKLTALYPLKEESSQNTTEDGESIEKCIQNEAEPIVVECSRADMEIEDTASSMNKSTIKKKGKHYTISEEGVEDEDIIISSKKIQDTVLTIDELTVENKGKHCNFSVEDRKNEEVIISFKEIDDPVSTTDKSTVKKKDKHNKFSKTYDKEIIKHSAEEIKDTISASDKTMKLKDKHRSVCKEEEEMEDCIEDGEIIDSSDEIKEDTELPVKIGKNYKVSKLHLLLSPIQLAMEHFPLPPNVFGPSKSCGFKYTKDSYTPVTENSPMFAIDCEMCLTTNNLNELTRVAIVNEDLETVYETLVKPKAKIVNYLTKYSGVTKEMLEGVTTTLEDVQRDIKSILPSDAILVGQSLNFDLIALKLMHPYVIDTSVIFNNNGVRKKKVALRKLVLAHLNEVIQDKNKIGHHPVEDSIGAMKLVQFKLQNTLWYGDRVLLNAMESNQISSKKIKGTDKSTEKQSSTHYKFSENDEKMKIIVNNKSINEPEYVQLDMGPEYCGFFERITKCYKKACLVGNEDALSHYRFGVPSEKITKVIKSSNKEIVKVISSCLDSNNLIIGHLQLNSGLEVLDEINECVKDVFDSLPHNALFIFLAGKKVDAHFKHRFCMTILKDAKHKL